MSPTGVNESLLTWQECYTVKHCNSHEKTTDCFKSSSTGKRGLALNSRLPNKEQTNYAFFYSSTMETKVVHGLWWHLSQSNWEEWHCLLNSSWAVQGSHPGRSSGISQAAGSAQILLWWPTTWHPPRIPPSPLLPAASSPDHPRAARPILVGAG